MTEAPAQLLTGARIFTGTDWVDGSALLVRDGRIAAILPDAMAVPGAALVRLPRGSVLAPGFLDLQVNGGGGILFNGDQSVDALLAMARAHRHGGTTALLPTFITGDGAAMRAAADAAAEAARIPGSGIAGLHLEGPFLNMDRRGVHEAGFVRAPSEADLEFLCGLPARFPGGRVLVTLAPEAVGPEVVRRLADSGLVVAGGHSAATLAQTRAAVAAGLSGFTHLFNAMPPVANREPGIAFAAMTSAETWCGIIADGVHVHPDLLRTAVALKPPGRVFLVTDAMPPTGTAVESFTLYDRTILRRDGRLVTEDGVLAGADLDMVTAVRNTVRLLGQPLEEALRMAALYPAEFVGLADRHGRIGEGRPADLVLLDPTEIRVLDVWTTGRRTGGAQN